MKLSDNDVEITITDGAITVKITNVNLVEGDRPVEVSHEGDNGKPKIEAKFKGNISTDPVEVAKNFKEAVLRQRFYHRLLHLC